MAAPKKPNPGPAAKKRREQGDATAARRLRAAGWTVTPPDPEPELGELTDKLRAHPMQYAYVGGEYVHETISMTNDQVCRAAGVPPGLPVERYNRCSLCEQWSPCDVRKQLRDQREAVWEKRVPYGIYSRWVKTGDTTSRFVWLAIQEAFAAGQSTTVTGSSVTDGGERDA